MTETPDFKLETLCAIWRAEKEKEDTHRANRLRVEQEITAILGHAPDHVGKDKAHGLEVRFAVRHKVDGEVLRQLAKEGKVTDETMGTVFRWKPELVASEWEAAPDVIKGVLAEAVTTVPAKPSFSVERKRRKK